MVTVLIIGIVAAVVIPNLSRQNDQMDDEAVFRSTRMALHRCRAVSISSAAPATSPTAFVLFNNGYACIDWNDYANSIDSKLGTGTVNPGANGILDAGEAQNEIVRVHFQERFDPTFDIVASGQTANLRGAYVSVPDSVLQGADNSQDQNSGFVLPIRPGGYFVSNTGSTFVARLAFRSKSLQQANYVIYPSGQVVGK
jgi:type II secretory pathway pseudopilin PulG